MKHGEAILKINNIALIVYFFNIKDYFLLFNIENNFYSNVFLLNSFNNLS